MMHKPCIKKLATPISTCEECCINWLLKIRPWQSQSIERLIGEKGVLYLIELSSAAEPFLTQLVQQYGPPPGLARVFQHQITPGMLNEKNLGMLFPSHRFTLVETGPSQIHTVHTLPTGEVVKVPAFWAIFRRRED